MPPCQTRRSARSRTRPRGRFPSPLPSSATSQAAPSALPTEWPADRALRQACCTPPPWRTTWSWLRSAAIEERRWPLKRKKKEGVKSSGKEGRRGDPARLLRSRPESRGLQPAGAPARPRKEGKGLTPALRQIGGPLAQLFNVTVEGSGTEVMILLQ